MSHSWTAEELFLVDWMLQDQTVGVRQFASGGMKSVEPRRDLWSRRPPRRRGRRIDTWWPNGLCAQPVPANRRDGRSAYDSNVVRDNRRLVVACQRLKRNHHGRRRRGHCHRCKPFGSLLACGGGSPVRSRVNRRLPPRLLGVKYAHLQIA